MSPLATIAKYSVKALVYLLRLPVETQWAIWNDFPEKKGELQFYSDRKWLWGYRAIQQAKTYLDDGSPKKTILWKQQQRGLPLPESNSDYPTNVFQNTFAFWMVNDNDQSRCVNGAKQPNLLGILVAHFHAPSNTVMFHGDFINSGAPGSNSAAPSCKDALKRSANVNFLPLVERPRSLVYWWGSLGLGLISTGFSTVSWNVFFRYLFQTSQSSNYFSGSFWPIVLLLLSIHKVLSSPLLSLPNDGLGIRKSIEIHFSSKTQ